MKNWYQIVFFLNTLAIFRPDFNILSFSTEFDLYLCPVFESQSINFFQETNQP